MKTGFIKRGLTLFGERNLLELGAEAGRVCRKIHPEKIVTFINDRNINYTNICIGRCRFCAFHRDGTAVDSYVLSYGEIGRKIEEARAYGAVQILLQGGLNPDLRLDWYQGLLRYIKKNHPIHVHGFSAPEIDHICRVSRLGLEAVLEALIEAGLDSIPGGGAEVLCSRVRRRLSPRKIGVRRWLEIHETAHRLGGVFELPGL